MESASAFIDQRIKELGDWRGKMLAKVRQIIHAADPEIVEEWKWRGTPVFSHGGIVCTGETYKSVVKMTFAKGAALQDPSGLFNSSLDGNVRRAIDIHESDKVDEAALKGLIRAAVALNLESKRSQGPASLQPADRLVRRRPRSAVQTVLLPALREKHPAISSAADPRAPRVSHYRPSIPHEPLHSTRTQFEKTGLQTLDQSRRAAQPFGNEPSVLRRL